MSKRTKRTVAEEEYMKNHRNDNMYDIAEALDRSYEFVRKFIGTLPPEPTPTKQQKTTRLITETAHGRKGVAIMTEAASQQGDAHRKKKKKVIGRPDCIRKIKDD